MESKVNFALVGGFVLALGAALIAGVLWLSSERSYRAAYDNYLVYLTESVSGLSPDAAVRYRGVKVGQVRRIELPPGDPERVRLTLEVESGTPVKQDTVAILITQGLTGISNVELTGGSRDSPALAPTPGERYPVIRSAPSLMLRLESAVGKALDNLNRSSEGVNALLDDGNRAALRETLANLQLVSRTLAERSKAIGAGVDDAARAAQNTVRLTEQLSRLAERVQRSADGFDRMTGEGARAGASAASAIDDTHAELKAFAEETLPEARALLAELRTLTASLKRFSEQLERDPSVLLRGRAPPRRGPAE
ncbi:MAG TPA: MlaD family protein [Burkholderiales bacterium]|nr:MlaD family protein [Burkholderiales bacterium]